MNLTLEDMLRGLLCILGAFAVILGAFGAHGLEEYLSGDQRETYDTAVLYHFIHVLAGLYGISQMHEKERWARLSVVFFTFGIVLFSGSLYLLSTADLTSIPTSWIGPVTPVGGVFFIFGWLSLAYHHIKS